MLPYVLNAALTLELWGLSVGVQNLQFQKQRCGRRSVFVTLYLILQDSKLKNASFLLGEGKSQSQGWERFCDILCFIGGVVVFGLC